MRSGRGIVHIDDRRAVTLKELLMCAVVSSDTEGSIQHRAHCWSAMLAVLDLQVLLPCCQLCVK